MITRRTSASLTNSKRINLFWVYKQNLTQHKDKKEKTARCASLANSSAPGFQPRKDATNRSSTRQKEKKKRMHEKEKRIIVNHFSFQSESKNAG